MKIRTQLIISSVVFLVIAIIIAFFFVSTYQQLNLLNKQEQIANNLSEEANGINYLTDEYLLYHDERYHSLWESVDASFASDLSALKPQTAGQQELIADMQDNQQGLNEVFESAASANTTSSAFEGSSVQVSWSRMAVQTQGLIADTTQLGRLSDNEVLQAIQMRNILIFALMCTFIAFLFVSSFLFYRRTLVEINDLQKGAQIVGKGNLDHVIENIPDDEIGDLALSFNQMTHDLKGVTTSKADLEREIALRRKAEIDLLKKNEDLNSLNEELAASEEELQQNVEQLALREQDLQKALEEKEVLLSEIHHRVKNNLTAFISLLSLDGTYEDSETGRALRRDLQNRARSMALIHETPYRTGKFSNVDMGVYLKNLIDQIAQSYGIRENIHVVVEVHDVTLSIDRATTAGLIINELVTNSFKYAFPPEFDCRKVRGEPCTIRVTLAHENGVDVLRVADNGRGFPEEFDPTKSKFLGLKLVNFLSRHQLMADISIQRDKGTEFVFRLKSTGNTP